MQELLRRFNGDVSMRDALKEYFNNVIASEALNMMYDKKDVTHIADAHMLLNKVFEQLDTDYGIQELKKESTNQAK